MEEAIHALEQDHDVRDRLGEEAEVAHEDDQEAVMERERADPEPQARPVDHGRLLVPLHLHVPEERPEAQDLERHPADHADRVVRVIEPVGLDPFQRLLLPAGRGDPEGDRRLRPVHDAVDEADQERGDGGVRQDGPEEELRVQDPRPHVRREHDRQHRDQ